MSHGNSDPQIIPCGTIHLQKYSMNAVLSRKNGYSISLGVSFASWSLMMSLKLGVGVFLMRFFLLFLAIYYIKVLKYSFIDFRVIVPLG